MGKRKRFSKQQSQTGDYLELTETAIDLPDATSSHFSSLPTIGSLKVADEEATATTPIDDDDSSRPYAHNWPELADKHFFSQPTISFKVATTMCLLVAGLIFLQDNNAGQLKSWHDILWTLAKCAVAIVFIVLVAVFFSTIRWIQDFFEKR